MAFFSKIANSLAELSETPAQSAAGMATTDMDFVNPSPSPSRAPSERIKPNASSSSLGSLGSPSPDKPAWRRFVSRAGRLIQDMVDLDDEYDVVEGDTAEASATGCEREQRRSPVNLEDWKREEREERTISLGDTTEPTPLYRADVRDDGVHYEREPSEPSQLISIDDMNAISSHAPLRHRHKKWVLLYSTLRDGISMQTLLRKAKGHAPTVLLVRDMSRHVFGAFCSESWRMSQRYFGTGETFVFRVEPNPAVWKWWFEKSYEQQNDFFLWGSTDGIAVGGAGGYAIWLDSQLCRGLSRCSATFGNACLASAEEFPVGAAELWGLV